MTTNTRAPSASTVAKVWGGAGRDGHAITGLENPPRVADEHLEATTEYTEGLIRSVVHMGWRLVAGVVLQVPSSDHEVIHTAKMVPGGALRGRLTRVRTAHPRAATTAGVSSDEPSSATITSNSSTGGLCRASLRHASVRSAER
jgi:hypothetical protein